MAIVYANYYQNVTGPFVDIKGVTFRKTNRIIEDGNDDLDTPDVISRVSESIELTIDTRNLSGFSGAGTTYGAGNAQVVVLTIYDAEGTTTAVMTITGPVLMSRAIENDWSNLFMMRYTFRCDSWSITGTVSA
jgi:hypothetical protein